MSTGGRVAAGTLIGVLVITLGWMGWRRVRTPATVTGSPVGTSIGSAAAADRPVPVGTRVLVAVLNGTTTRGLARRATRVLRDAGFDVVASGNAEAPEDSSVVYRHAGDTLWAQWAARAIGGARIIARPDSSGDLHLTVVVGRTWRPPADPFDP